MQMDVSGVRNLGDVVMNDCYQVFLKLVWFYVVVVVVVGVLLGFEVVDVDVDGVDWMGEFFFVVQVIVFEVDVGGI